MINTSLSSFMAKRHGDSVHGVNVNIKKRKGIRVRTVTIPDSDDPPPNVTTEYARLLKTRVAISGKADSVTMNSLPFFEINNVAHDNSLEPTLDSYEEAAAENLVPGIPVKKRRKKVNDSVRCILLNKKPPR